MPMPDSCAEGVGWGGRGDRVGGGLGGDTLGPMPDSPAAAARLVAACSSS